MRRALPWIAVACFASGFGCTQDPPIPAGEAEAVVDFGEVSIGELRADPERHAGVVFEETFTFARIWWGRSRARPGEQSLEVETHFTARAAHAPLYIVRIEFSAAFDEQVERMRAGRDVRLRVRFLRLHAPSRSPVFSLLEVLPPTQGRSDLDSLRR